MNMQQTTAKNTKVGFMKVDNWQEVLEDSAFDIMDNLYAAQRGSQTALDTYRKLIDRCSNALGIPEASVTTKINTIYAEMERMELW